MRCRLVITVAVASSFVLTKKNHAEEDVRPWPAPAYSCEDDVLDSSWFSFVGASVYGEARVMRGVACLTSHHSCHPALCLPSGAHVDLDNSLMLNTTLRLPAGTILKGSGKNGEGIDLASFTLLSVETMDNSLLPHGRALDTSYDGYDDPFWHIRVSLRLYMDYDSTTRD